MKKHTFFIRLFLSIFFTVLALGIIFVAALPSMISSPSGKERFLRLLNGQIPGCVKIEQVHLSWFGYQEVKGFSLSDEENNPILTFESFRTEAALFPLLFGKRDLGKTSLMTPYVYLYEDHQGRLNVSKAIGEEKEEKKKPERSSSINLKGDFTIHNGTLVMKTPKIEAITLSNVEVEISTKPSHLQFSSNTRQGAVEGAISARAYSEEGKLNVLADINHFPLALLDQLTESSLFSAALGPTLDCKVTIDEKANRYFLNAQMKAANLSGELTGVASNSTFAFDSNSKLLFSLTPAFFSKLFPQEHWKLSGKSEVTFKIKELRIPLDLLTRFKVEELNNYCLPFAAEITLPKTDLVHTTFGNLSIDEGKIDFASHGVLEMSYSTTLQSKEGLSHLAGNVKCEKGGKYSFFSNNKDVPTPLLELLFEEGSNLSAILGQRFDFNTSGFFNKGALDANFALSTKALLLEGDVHSDSLEAIDCNGKGKFFLPSEVVPYLGASADFIYDCELAYLKHHLSVPLVNVKVKNPYLNLEVKGVLGKRGLPFSYPDVDVVAKGEFYQPLKQKFLDQGSLLAHINGRKNEINADLALNATHERTREVKAHLKVENFYDNQGINIFDATYNFDAKAIDLPTVELMRLFDEEMPLELFIGEKLQGNIQGKYENNAAKMTFLGQGEGVDVKMDLCFDQETKRLEAAPFEVLWTLNDKRYRGLYHHFSKGNEPRFHLIDETTGKLEVKKLSFPTYTTQNPLHFISESSLEALLSFTPLCFEEIHNKQKFSLEKISGSLSGENVKKALHSSLDFIITSPEIPADKVSEVTFKGEIFDLLSPEGHLDLAKMKAEVDLKVDLLPVRTITELFPMNVKTKKRIDSLLGDLVNAHFKGEFSEEKGPLMIDMKATNLKVVLPLYFDHGVITLTKTVEAEVTLTPEINEAFLSELNPLLITGAYSEHPVRFFIDQEGFVLPLHPFSLENLSVERAILDLGKIYVKNGGQIQSIMKFLKATNISDEGVMEAWFTPIFFSLKGGVLSYKRFDVYLASMVHIALWGGIDLVNDRVKMILGISPKNLRSKFNVLGLAKKEMFQVKMRGTTSELDLDWSSAYTRLGILLTRTAGGHIGYVVGGILEQFMSAFGEEPTPPPTTSPLPWENKEAMPEKEGMPEEAPPPQPTSNDGFKKLMEIIVP